MSHHNEHYNQYNLFDNCSSNCSDERIREIIAEAINSTDAGDATWILTSAFIIFTMQSGFGLLEAGSCSVKNECNIMIKNAVDVVFGALGYWLIGFGLSFGQDEYSNAFCGVGSFLTDSTADDMGHLYAKYFFQLSFATTATTIVSGAMAERTNLKAYMLFSFLNMFSYVFPAHWMWDNNGFLKIMGAVDIAGAGPVHLIGGVSAMVATLMLKPRHRRFEKDNEHKMASPTNVVLGTFMLWWGWLGFNCGSTFGVSGGKWQLASRAAVVTVNGSVGGGLFAVLYCYGIARKKYDSKLDVSAFTTAILGGLVGITGICAICRPWEALIIGFIGGAIGCFGTDLMDLLRIDDPVSCIPVHGFAAIWGMLSIGLFADIENMEQLNSRAGLFKGGGWELLGLQTLAVVCFCVWAAIMTFLELYLSNLIFGLRMSLEEEVLGADFVEHGISQENEDSDVPDDIETAKSQLAKRKVSRASHIFGAHVDSQIVKRRTASNLSRFPIEETIERPTKKNELNCFDRLKKFFKCPEKRKGKKSRRKTSANPKDEQLNNNNNKNNNNQYFNSGVVNFGYLTITDGTVTTHAKSVLRQSDITMRKNSLLNGSPNSNESKSSKRRRSYSAGDQDDYSAFCF